MVTNKYIVSGLTDMYCQGCLTWLRTAVSAAVLSGGGAAACCSLRPVVVAVMSASTAVLRPACRHTIQHTILSSAH